MKTTLQLDDDLLRLAMQRAAAEGIAVSVLVEDALRAKLLPRAEQRPTFKLDLSVADGDKQPTVDIADRNAWYDLMEQR